MIQRTTSALLLTLVPAALGGGTGSDARSWTLAVQPEEPAGYAANPSTLRAPLRQDLTQLRLERGADELYRIVLAGEAQAPVELGDVDLGLLLPRVPSYARANEDLLRYALLQREFNRNEVRFGPAGAYSELKLANNCMRSGLWEILLEQTFEQGSAMTYHGWFAFPADEYARRFEQLNGRSLAACEALVARYPIIDGMPAPLDALRTVVDERELPLETFASEAPIRFGEQARKAKLVLTPGIESTADFQAPERQPIRMAAFSEPGFYDPAQPLAFDLGWLGRPAGAVRRSVRVGTGLATELELRFAGGRRIVLADRELGALPARTQAPQSDKDTLRLTFGIGTPDIYATRAERQAELAEERPSWLFLLGPDGTHADNHLAGVDRVFCWNERDERLHLYLVGYERIAVVAHLAVPLGAD